MRPTAILLQSQRFTKQLHSPLLKTIQIATSGTGHTRATLLESQDASLKTPTVTYTLPSPESRTQVSFQNESNNSENLWINIDTPPTGPSEQIQVSITIPQHTILSRVSLEGTNSDLIIPTPPSKKFTSKIETLFVNVNSGNTTLSSPSLSSLSSLQISTNHGFITLGKKVHSVTASLYTKLGDISGSLKKFSRVNAHTERGNVSLDLEPGLKQNETGVGSEIKATSGFGDVKLNVFGFSGNVVAQSSGQPVVKFLDAADKALDLDDENSTVLPRVERREVPGEVVAVVGENGSGNILGQAEKGRLIVALGI
ncbi:UNVERIFIED_CONTAM: hypothetical protein HDU68_008394 [Siphonaria sp. JEL0065]|nr:hypothetical protein HDU68_008394 [Siphonaria sp. JEL0065]